MSKEDTLDIQYFFRQLSHFARNDTKKRGYLVATAKFLDKYKCNVKGQDFIGEFLYLFTLRTKLWKCDETTYERFLAYRPIFNILFDAGINMSIVGMEDYVSILEDYGFFNHAYIDRQFIGKFYTEKIHPAIIAWRKLWETIPHSEEKLSQKDIKNKYKHSCGACIDKFLVEMETYVVSKKFSRKQIVDTLSDFSAEEKELMMYYLVNFMTDKNPYNMYYRYDSKTDLKTARNILELFLEAGFDQEYFFNLTGIEEDKIGNFRKNIFPLIEQWINYWRRTNIEIPEVILEDIRENIISEYY